MALSLKDVGLDKKPKKILHVSELGIIPPWKDILRQSDDSPSLLVQEIKPPDSSFLESPQVVQSLTPNTLATREQVVSKQKEDPQTPEKQVVTIEQTDNTSANWPQTGHKLATEAATKRPQTDHKLTTNRPQENDIEKPIKENRPQTDYKPTTKLTTEATTNRPQTNHKLATNRPQISVFLSLIGLQREVSLYLYNLTRKERSKITPPLPLENIARDLSTTAKSVKGTLQRLEQKGILTRVNFKNGRGGWSQYSLPEQIYHEILQHETDHKPTTKWPQTDHKVTTKPTTEVATTGSNNNSNIDPKEIITIQPEKFELAEEWVTIDIAPLGSIDFTIRHLAEIAKKAHLTSEQVQDSIYQFAFDLEFSKNKLNSKILENPRTFFISNCIKNGPYLAIGSYEHPKKRKLREWEERQSKLRLEEQALEKKIMGHKFYEWEKTLSEEQKKEISPFMSNPGAARTATLQGYFEKEIWPTMREKTLAGILG